MLAIASGKSVVPLSHNAGTFWPRRGFVKKPGTIRVIIGEPIEPAGKNPRQLNEEVKQSIEAGLARIAVAVRATEVTRVLLHGWKISSIRLLKSFAMAKASGRLGS